jgi:hypothetical protein
LRYTNDQSGSKDRAGHLLHDLFPKLLPELNSVYHATGSKGEIFDPLTCAPFQGNIIPKDRLNPVSVNYLNAFPLPTRTDRLIGNYFFQQTQIGKYNTFDMRLDWNASAKDLFFFRFSYDNTSSNQNSQLAQNEDNPPLNASGQENYLHGRGYDLGYTHTFSTRIVNEARIAYNREITGIFLRITVLRWVRNSAFRIQLWVLRWAQEDL